MTITTNKEYISATLEGFNLSGSDIELILLKSSLNGSSPLDIEDCDNAIYNRLSIVLKATIADVSESGYSVSWDVDRLKMYYQTLCVELGKENVLTPKIRNRSNYW